MILIGFIAVDTRYGGDKISAAVANQHVYVYPKRPGSMQGSMQKTANYLQTAALQAHGTELPQVACYRIAERKNKTPTTTKSFVSFIARYMFRFL
jgi:hypothetical protein